MINVRAVGKGHSDLFSMKHNPDDGRTALEASYSDYWRPFLTFPQVELADLPDRHDPATRWRPFPLLLRGSLFPFVAVPFEVALIAAMLAIVGHVLWPATVVIAMAATGLLILIAALIGVTLL